MKERLATSSDGGFRLTYVSSTHPVVPGTLQISTLMDDKRVFEDDMFGNIRYIKPLWREPELSGWIDYTTGEFSLPFHKSNRYDILKNKISIVGENQKIKFVYVDYETRHHFIWHPMSESEIPCDIRGGRPFYRVWLDDNNYFIYDIVRESALSLQPILPWKIVCYNTDFHNEYLLCQTYFDIDNLISRWCYKKNIDVGEFVMSNYVEPGVYMATIPADASATDVHGIGLINPAATAVTQRVITQGQRRLQASFTLRDPNLPNFFETSVVSTPAPGTGVQT